MRQKVVCYAADEVVLAAEAEVEVDGIARGFSITTVPLRRMNALIFFDQLFIRPNKQFTIFYSSEYVRYVRLGNLALQPYV